MIYKVISQDSRVKKWVRCTINKKYKKLVNKWISETVKILGVELKIKENVTTIVTYGPNEYEITRNKDDFWEN